MEEDRAVKRMGDGDDKEREKETRVEQEEEARPGSGAYICFMILFCLTKVPAEYSPLSGAAGGGCAQKAERMKWLPLLHQAPS